MEQVLLEFPDRGKSLNLLILADEEHLRRGAQEVRKESSRTLAYHPALRESLGKHKPAEADRASVCA